MLAVLRPEHATPVHTVLVLCLHACDQGST